MTAFVIFGVRSISTHLVYNSLFFPTYIRINSFPPSINIGYRNE